MNAAAEILLKQLKSLQDREGVLTIELQKLNEAFTLTANQITEINQSIDEIKLAIEILSKPVVKEEVKNVVSTKKRSKN